MKPAGRFPFAFFMASSRSLFQSSYRAARCCLSLYERFQGIVPHWLTRDSRYAVLLELLHGLFEHLRIYLHEHLQRIVDHAMDCPT